MSIFETCLEYAKAIRMFLMPIIVILIVIFFISYKGHDSDNEDDK